MEDPSFLAETGDNDATFVASNAGGATSAQGLSANFDKETWEAIEKKLSSHEIDVLKVLVDYAFGVDANVSHPIYSISDNFYRQFRKDLMLSLKRTKTSVPVPLSLVLGPLDPIVQPPVEQSSGKGKKVKPKPLSKADEIRQKNSVSRIKQSVDNILETFKKDFSDITSVSLTASMNSDVVEIKGIGLLYACAWLDHHIAIFNTEEHYAKVFDIIAVSQKFVNICKRDETNCISQVSGEAIKPSATLVIDLERWIARLRSVYVKAGVCVFNWENIQRYAPQIFVQSEYQKALPQQFVKAKLHQKHIVDAVRNNIERGAWIVYDAMIGSGKTTAEVGIAALVSYLRISNPSLHGKKRFLSVCNSEAVRLDVAQKLYNAATTFPTHKIHFAISYLTVDSLKKPKVKIVKNNACSKDEDIVTVIASPSVAKMILDENAKLDDGDPSKYEYILFVDEPTMGADNIHSRSLYDNVSVNHVSPYITINSSATFPNIGMLENITSDFFSRHRHARQVRVYSDEISIGCDIRTLHNEIVVPHLGATNRTQLSEIINCVANCSFLGKAYTPSVVDSLYQRMLHYHVNDFVELPDIQTLFSNVENLDINRVRRLALELLTKLATQNDDVIQMVCATNISDDDEEEEDDVPTSGFSFSANPTSDDVVTDPIDYLKLGTTQAYRLQGQTLIATANPEEFVLNNFKSLIDQVYASETNKIVTGGDVATYRYKSTGDAMRRYMSELSDWEKKIVTIDKNATSPDDKAAKLDEHDKLKPVFPFPEWAHVGSEAHINKFARSHRDKILRNLVRGKLNVPHLTSSDKIINVDDRVLTALFCGVAIYSTETVKCRVYLDIVLQLASAGALAFVVADSTICFGTNYPFFNVIITQEFSELHSMLVLFQVMGRAGRPGKSPKALIIVPDTVARRIINFVTTANEADFEARNMETIFVRQKIEIEAEEERQIAEKIAKATVRSNPVVSGISVIRGRTVETVPVVEQVAEPLIVPISDVPDGSLRFAPSEQSGNRRTPLKSGDWRTNTRSNSGSEWQRAPPQPPQDRRRDNQSSAGGSRQERDQNSTGSRQDRNQNSGGGGRYVPPSMRDRTSEQEKAPRYKSDSKFGEKKPTSSSSGWKKESK